MSLADPRVKNWPLMDSPLPTITICLSYVYLVKVLGPKIMENRKPFEVRKAMIIYNFFMVVCSTVLVYTGLRYQWLNGESLKCAPVDYSTNFVPMMVAYNSYFYFLTKFIEFMDTIFFVIRKKNSQISTLHVIHHGIMPFSVWWGVKFVPGGHATFFGFLNSIVHMVMYTYYGLAAIGPHMNKYLWWKKYLTAFQMVQFVLIGLHSFQLLFRQCDFPKIFVLWIGSHGVLFWFLFSDFYKKTYAKKKKDDQEISNNNTKESIDSNAQKSPAKSSAKSTFFSCNQTEKLLDYMRYESTLSS